MCSANALRHVDELLLQQMPPAALEELKLVQMLLQDVAVLACSSGLHETILHTKGIPTQLLDRMEASFKESLQDMALRSVRQ